MSDEKTMLEILQQNEEFYVEAEALAKKYDRELKCRPISTTDSRLRIDMIPKTEIMPRLTKQDVKEYAEFCSNVSFWIVQNKQDVRQVAQDIHILSHELKQILNGNRIGSLSTYVRLSDLTGVPLDALKESA